MKNTTKTEIDSAFPELLAGIHLPVLGIVVAITDPPIGGGSQFTHERPQYAVDVQIMTEDLEPDYEIPVILDVPVALPAGGAGRGIAALQQPGTIVELAFAFGRQDRPFVRSVLPYNLPLPTIDAIMQKWQQSPVSYQQVDAIGNWQRMTVANITDIASQLWIGSPSDNLLQILSDFMVSVNEGLTILAAHTHATSPPPDQGGGIGSVAGQVAGQNARVETIKKPTP